MKNVIIAVTFIVLTACSKDETPKDYSSENDLEIQAYIDTNNLDAQKSDSGLYYVIDEVGTGENPISTDRVKVAYKGYLTDGTVFDESEEGVSIYLQNVIRGWAEGVTYFKEGGSGKLIIPAHLAYGSNDFQDVPGGSVVIYDFELIYVNYASDNDDEIQKYIEDNNLTAQKTSSGLYYTIDTEGTGDQPTSTDNVTVAYKGYFTDGEVFDDGDADGVSFNLNQVISGWTEGITYFKEGGSGMLLIPSHLAYGIYGSGSIPGGAVLIFDVDLKSVN